MFDFSLCYMTNSDFALCRRHILEWLEKRFPDFRVPPPAQIERSESYAGENSACALFVWDSKGAALPSQQARPRAGVAKILSDGEELFVTEPFNEDASSARVRHLPPALEKKGFCVIIFCAPIAQLVEQLPLKEMVQGSNPCGRT